ncbi:MAG: hypothetical protein DRI44_02665 [Chlamydiae bacterium]|nr:MAG: hypothetical protein DRI44_02665 [Chlamydiota bacterium]
MLTDNVIDERYYIHSKCCGAHWEMVWDTKRKIVYFECEKCGRDSGIVIPDTYLNKKPKCECCDNE